MTVRPARRTLFICTEGRATPPVLIACPVTNDLVPTGAHANGPDDLERLPDENLLIACPDCGKDHEWTRQDAVLAPG